MRKRIVCAALLGCLLLWGCQAAADPMRKELQPPRDTAAPTASPTAAPTAAPAPQPFSILWIPDTQNMTREGYAPVAAMADWAAENKEKYNLRYAVHTGDIVNAGRKSESWERIAPVMQRLAENVPLMTAAGNHDVGLKDDYSYRNYLRWRFDTPLPEPQLFQGGRGSYALLDTEVGEFLLVSIGSFPDADSYAWLNEVFQKYPQRIGILAIHDYLRPRGEHSSYGKRVFERVVVPSSNVRFVLCGHNGGVSERVDELDDDGDGVADRSVYQMMLNFQDDEKRTGYVRILTFHADRSLEIATYSPYLDDYDYYEEPVPRERESFTIENAF